eukprot:XP_003727054.1 PREDICTED: uncharacterized protein LOC100890359 [Strongylocentrotus purpuratus]
MARGSVNGAPNPAHPPPFHEGIMNGHTTVISERDRVVLRRSARARRGASMQRPRRTTLAFGITQVILGLAIVAVSFTAFALSTSNRIRNACPYWAGFSVLFTGGVGLIAWKQPSSLAISFFTFLSALCVVLHLVATALSGLSCAELQVLTGCTKHPGTLVCYCCTSSLPCTPTENAISVEGVKDCSTISSTIRLVMFIICVANIVACLICIAATIVGCAYIVKRHANRRMVLRRPHHTGSIARDSYISDIGGVIDSVFTPPLVPPPPYSPPEYTEISNDPIIIEGPDFLDDLSTPTPVLPIAPHEMPPPYSTLDLLPGTTIECSVAQEFQMANEEISNFPDNRREENGDVCLGEGYVPANQLREHHVPLPPIRWDSHTLTLDLTRTPGFTNGYLSRRNEDTANYLSLSSCERRSRRSNRRRRSPGDGRSGDSDQSGRRRNRSRGNAQTLPLPGRTAMGMQAPLRTSACLDDRRGMIEERIVTGASCEAILPNTVENMWARIESRSANVRSVGNHTNGIGNGNEETIMDRQYDRSEGNTVLDNNSERTEDSHKTSSTSTSPLQNRSPPSEHSPSGSSERLTGGTASSSSRNTRTSSSTQRRQRRRRSSDRRMRTSSSNYSTSSTDHSSKSNGGIRQTARARQQQLFSTSSSSDSDDNTPQRPRRLIARMGNGGVTHEVDKQGQSGQSNGPSRSRRHTRGSRNRQRPVSAQPTVGRQSLPQSQTTANAKPNARPGTCHERNNATHGLSPSSIQFNQHGRVKQKRPDSLDLKLIWSSHRGYIGHQNSLSTSSSADSYDPWIPRDGVTIATNKEKLTVNMAASESKRSKVPQAAPSCIKKKQLHRMSEGKNHPRNNLPASLQLPDNNTRVRINPTCNDNGVMAEMGLPSSNIEREHATPEKDMTPQSVVM